MNKSLSDYRKLRDEIDLECDRLSAIHRKELKCAPGCTSCCMNFRIFPVEFHSILSELSGMPVKISGNMSGSGCIFLVKGLCSIYESRPFICRTHGLPLLAMGEEGWELSLCELNFTGNAPEFDETNTIPHDRYNSRLFLINREFIRSFEAKRYSEFDLVSVGSLLEEAQSSERRANRCNSVSPPCDSEV